MNMTFNKKYINRILKIAATAILAAAIYIAVTPVDTQAKVYLLPDGTMFDSDFYATIYPEMQAAYANGKYPERLLWHYLTYGIKEGRLPSLYSTYNPSPAVSSTPYVYPGNYCVVPYTTLYPYTPYVLPSTVIKGASYPYPVYANVNGKQNNIAGTTNPYAYMCIPYAY